MGVGVFGLVLGLLFFCFGFRGGGGAGWVVVLVF